MKDERSHYGIADQSYQNNRSVVTCWYLWGKPGPIIIPLLLGLMVGRQMQVDLKKFKILYILNYLWIFAWTDQCNALQCILASVSKVKVILNNTVFTASSNQLIISLPASQQYYIMHGRGTCTVINSYIKCVNGLLIQVTFDQVSQYASTIITMNTVGVDDWFWWIPNFNFLQLVDQSKPVWSVDATQPNTCCWKLRVQKNILSFYIT